MNELLDIAVKYGWEEPDKGVARWIDNYITQLQMQNIRLRTELAIYKDTSESVHHIAIEKYDWSSAEEDTAVEWIDSAARFARYEAEELAKAVLNEWRSQEGGRGEEPLSVMLARHIMIDYEGGAS